MSAIHDDPTVQQQQQQRQHYLYITQMTNLQQQQQHQYFLFLPLEHASSLRNKNNLTISGLMSKLFESFLLLILQAEVLR